MPAVYVVRTHMKKKAPYAGIFDELRVGRARFGFSYQDNLDLRLIQEKQKRGEQLTKEEGEAEPGLGFLTQPALDDYFIYPHQPEADHFLVVKVTGDYDYLHPPIEADGLGPDGNDFRSFRPCSLITSQPVGYHDRIVSDEFRRILRGLRRFYDVDQVYKGSGGTKPFFRFLEAYYTGGGPNHEPREMNAKVNHPLNQILYGPPGTGKTYHTVDHALAIINPESMSESRENKVQRFREFQRSGRIAMVTFHQNFAYEDFIEGIRPELDDQIGDQIRYKLRDGIFKQIADMARAESDRRKRFVLIIDEINRGNIAKIFGELITLIEDSRRLGAEDETKVTLPYSQKSFGVPKNLYLIGTMNTADRSIQLLDTALRRRFTFVEMMPEPEHERTSKEVDDVNCQEMLKAMNERITALLDREHQIGHTYLMDVDTMEDLSGAFQNKIFPLLQEYFFDDWAKIRAVLGGNEFVSERNAPRLPADLEQGEDRKIYERLPGDDERWENSQQYRQIYPGDD